ncbi:MAG: S8 family serine peptidase [Thaumarchaeota archaeon]|nr:S8 family serine peptidase [Nitrososphaerota archaeon]
MKWQAIILGTIVACGIVPIQYSSIPFMSPPTLIPQAYAANATGSITMAMTSSVATTLPVVNPTNDIAVNPTTNTIYVTFLGAPNSTSVIDGATNTVTATIPIGSSSNHVAVNPTTNTIYVTNASKISAINGTTNTVTATIPIGSSSSNLNYVAVNPTTNTIYVTNASKISAINGTTNTVTATLDAGSDLNGIAINPTTNTIYVTVSNSYKIWVIDGTINAFTDTISVGNFPQSVAVNPVTNTIYVTTSTNSIFVIDGTTNTVTATIPIGSGPNHVAINPITNTIYVTSYDNTIYVIDGTTNTVTATIPIGSVPQGVAVNPVTNTIYTANRNLNTISVINGAINNWSSGEKISITLIDPDANKNNAIAEHLNVYDPTVERIATMRIGAPFTLTGGSADFFNFNNRTVTGSGFESSSIGASVRVLTQEHTAITDKAQDESISGRPVYTIGSSPATIRNHGGMIIDLKTTMQTLRDTIHDTAVGNPEKFKGFNFLNLDLRSFQLLSHHALGVSITSVTVYLAHNPGGPILDSSGNLSPGLNIVPIANTTSLQDFINLNVTSNKVTNSSQVNKDIFEIPKTDNIGLIFQFTTNGEVVLGPNQGYPIVSDFFSIGLTDFDVTNDQRINNAIYRFELEETGNNTNIFTGSNTYVMLNQLNIFDPNTYSTLKTHGTEVKFAAIQDMRQVKGNAPQVTYLDRGTNGINTIIAAQQDIRSHNGIVKFDQKKYNIGDAVGITLWDSDLNVENDLLDIYTSVPPSGNLATDPQDVTVDTIGLRGLGTNSYGVSFGKLLEIVFGNYDIRWSNSIIPGDVNHTSSCTFAAGDVNSPTATTLGKATSLSATGFTLVETGPSTGIFKGDFEFPDELCQSGVVVSTTGLDIKAKYYDFTDGSGRFAEKSDSVMGFGFVDTLKIVPEFATFTTINHVKPLPNSPDEPVPVIIFYRNSTVIGAGKDELRNLGLTPTKTIDILPSVSLDLTRTQLDGISNKYAVAIFRDQTVYASGIQTDNTIKANSVWPSYTGNGINIAILDSGIAEQPLLPPDLCHTTFSVGDCSDEVGHGTHVTGIALARGSTTSPASTPLIGVAPQASLIVVKVTHLINNLSQGQYSNVGAGIDWAIHYGGADVINLSLESAATFHDNENCDVDPISSNDVGGIYPYIYAALEHGVSVVAASGNQGDIASPACISKVIAVGAVDSSFQLFNDGVHSSGTGEAMRAHGLVAPGVNIMSTWPFSPIPPGNTSGMKSESGTSMAAPAVTGTIALMKQKNVASGNPPLDPQDISNILFFSACKFSCGIPVLPDQRFGNGMLDASAAVNLAAQSLPLTHRTHTDLTVSQPSAFVGDDITVMATVSDIELVKIKPVGFDNLVFFDTHHHYDYFTGKTCSDDLVNKQLKCTIHWKPGIADNFQVFAVFLGDGGFHHDMSSGSKSVNVIIHPPPTTKTTVTASKSSINKKDTTEIIVKVSPDPGVTPITSGSVTFQTTGLSGGWIDPPSPPCSPSGTDFVCHTTYHAPDLKGIVTIKATFSDTLGAHLGSDGHQDIQVTDCMFSTFAFGSVLEPQVKAIRDFRNHNLLQTKDGSSFMIVFNAWYYSFSPYVSDLERSQPWFKQMVMTSTYPLLDILTAAGKVYSVLPGEYGSLSSGLVASSLIGGVYFGPLALSSRQVRNHKYNYKLVAGIFFSILAATICSVILGNQIALMVTTPIFVISSTAIFATLSTKALVIIYKKIKSHI